MRNKEAKDMGLEDIKGLELDDDQVQLERDILN